MRERDAGRLIRERRLANGLTQAQLALKRPRFSCGAASWNAIEIPIDASTRSIPENGVLELDTDAGGIGIHAAPPGAAPYAELRARALVIELDVPVPVAALDDLTAMKRVSGRRIDRSDIVALTEHG